MKRLMTTVLMLALTLSLVAVAESAFSPGMLMALESATLVWQPHSDSPRPQGKAITTTIQDDRLMPLSKLLSEATEMEAGPGCPFYGEAMLSLETVDGQQTTLELAADDCTVYKLGERYFYYLPPEFRGKPERPHNHLLFDLFTWQERARLIDDERLKVDLLYDDWCLAYGSPWEWQMGTWQRFGEIFGSVAKAYIEKHPDAAGSWLFPMMQQKYARPGKGDLSLEEAISIAWDAAKGQLGMSQEEGIDRIPYGVFIANNKNRPVWKIHLYEWQKIAGTPYFQIDARSGEIQDMGRWPEQIDIVAAFSQGRDQMAQHTRVKPLKLKTNPHATNPPRDWSSIMRGGRMKGLLIVCLCLLLLMPPGLALERPPLHPLVIALCEKAYPEHAITAFDGFGNEEAGQWALILTKEGQHVLVIAEKGKDDPAYQLTVENPKAFMQGDSRPSVLIDSAGDALFFGCQNAYHIWDFMAVKRHGAWGQVSAQVWERNAVSPTSEYYMWVEDGMLHATHIISDGNDNTLSQTDYPPLPVPHLMGRMALHQFDYALMPATPQDLIGRHTPAGWPEAVAGALLHRGDRYIDGTVTPFGIFMLAQRAGERRLFIANWDKEAGRHRLTTSTALPENAEIDATHAGDIITVIIDRGAEPGDMYSFRRLAGGRWGLCYVAAYELFKTGPNFVWQQDRAGDFIHWGTTPFDDIERIDFRSLPRTVREALAMTDSAGWAAVDNPMPLDRLHLRAAPGQEARSLGEYYNGTPARVLERLGEWTQVDIAGVRGFMMTKYLVFGSDAGYVHRAFPEVYLHEMENESQMPVYTRPDEDAPLAFQYDKKPGDAFHVLGEANEEWFHVYFYELGIGCYMKKECFWEGQG